MASPWTRAFYSCKGCCGCLPALGCRTGVRKGTQLKTGSKMVQTGSGCSYACDELVEIANLRRMWHFQEYFSAQRLGLTSWATSQQPRSSVAVPCFCCHIYAGLSCAYTWGALISKQAPQAHLKHYQAALYVGQGPHLP